MKGEVFYGQVIQLKLYLNSFLASKTHMGFSQETIIMCKYNFGRLDFKPPQLPRPVVQKSSFFFFKNWASTEHSDANLAINPWSVTRLTDSKILNGREVNQ